jgi:hypothetical protein
MASAKAKTKPKTNTDITKFLLGDSKPSADAAELLAAIMDEIGGPRELARIFARQLRDPDTGAQTKQRLLDTIQRLIIMCTQHDLAKAIEPSEMTDDDLARVATRLLEKVQHANHTGTGTQE